MEIKFMRAALKEALKAARDGEVPVGAVVVMDGKIVSRAHNLMEKTQVATGHAEILAIEKACKKLKSWRLDGAEMYVTVEPCAMCAGAVASARIKKVYFGAYERKSGCAESLYPVLSENGLNHCAESEGGIMEEECSAAMKDFFKWRRLQKKEQE